MIAVLSILILVIYGRTDGALLTHHFIKLAIVTIIVFTTALAIRPLFSNGLLGLLLIIWAIILAVIGWATPKGSLVFSYNGKMGPMTRGQYFIMSAMALFCGVVWLISNSRASSRDQGGKTFPDK